MLSKSGSACSLRRIELPGWLEYSRIFSIHSENFYPPLLNFIFGWDLVNLNTEVQNATAIDLVDRKGRLVAQVSATGTKAEAINSTLAKDPFGLHRPCVQVHLHYPRGTTIEIAHL